MHKYLVSLVPVLERIEKNLGYKKIKVQDKNTITQVVTVKKDYEPGYQVYFFEPKEYKEAPF